MFNANKIIFKRSDYPNVEKFYEALFTQFKLLIESGKVFSFHRSPQDNNLIAIQFGSSEITDDSTYPVWLNADEIIQLTALAKLDEYEKAKQYIEDYERDPDSIDDDFGYSEYIKKDKNNGGNHEA